MADGILSFADGEIRLDGVLLPGVLKSLSVRGQVRFDTAKRTSLSGRAKVPVGWEDGDITAVVDLLSDDESTCYDKLAELNASFKGTDDGANPVVYSLNNSHTMARGIQEAVFSGLDSTETDDEDVIQATLTFVEHEPVIVRTETRVAASDQATGAATAVPSTTTAAPEADTAIMADTDPFTAGLNAGLGG